mmetsp:Transcript_88085/g.222354  ORF Transcript_88085/g.222354 Transcript_88085/m.222354 type:complete len:112 (+) Transcript_88085:436-771(+)
MKGVLGVQRRLSLCCASNEHLSASIASESHDTRCRTLALGVGHDSRDTSLDHSHQRVRGAEVDSNDLLPHLQLHGSYTTSLIQSAMLPSPGAAHSGSSASKHKGSAGRGGG